MGIGSLTDCVTVLITIVGVAVTITIAYVMYGVKVAIGVVSANGNAITSFVSEAAREI